MSTFGFRASAAAMGGVVNRPFREPLPVQAATMLPSVGGYGSARVEDYRYHEIVSFKAAYTQVIGNEYEKDGRRERCTLVLAVVEGLNVLDMVTADRVVGRLVSETPLPADEKQELTWLPAGSYFSNLRIAGVPVKATPQDLLMSREGQTVGGIQGLKTVRQGNPLRCSLFQENQPIHVDGFGDIFLGEYTVGRDYRKLTMIRLALGSPVEGDLAFANLEGNGVPY